jgi:hypothetical protein
MVFNNSFCSEVINSYYIASEPNGWKDENWMKKKNERWWWFQVQKSIVNITNT